MRRTRQRLATGWTLLAFLGVMAGLEADAQQFGQWNWYGSVGATSQGRSAETNGDESSTWQADELNVFAGMRGFVLHPAIAQFDVGIDVSLQRADASPDIDRLGYRGLVRLLPRSGFPMALYARRTNSGYGGLIGDDPLALRTFPDSVTSYGGRLRIRKGILRGLRLGFDSSSTGFVDEEQNPGDVYETGFVEWRGSHGNFSHFASLRRRLTEYGDLVYRLEDRTLAVGEQGFLGGGWNWRLRGSGLTRDYSYEGTASSSSSIYRLLNSLVNRTSASRVWTISHDFGMSSSGSGSSNQTQRLKAGVRDQRRGWAWSPFVALNFQEQEGNRLLAPEVGVGGDWTRELDRYTFGAGGSVSLLSQQYSAETDEGTQVDVSGRALAGSAAFSIDRLGDRGLREELQVSVARNEFRSAGEGVPDLPDLGVTLNSGFQDSLRGRLTISKGWDSTSLSVWTEYNIRTFEQEKNDNVTANGTVNDLQLSAQWNSPKYSLQVTGGSTEVDSSEQPQTLAYYSAAATMRLMRGLSVRASYQHTDQDIDLAPDITLDRIEAGVEFEIGLIRIAGSVFRTSEQRQGGIEYDSTGFRATIRRNFGGWLPIVSAPERRGVVK